MLVMALKFKLIISHHSISISTWTWYYWILPHNFSSSPKGLFKTLIFCILTI
ncbi:419L [Invertebrate iridescent virus Kaz2018]|uniref:Uncharacterized protein n=1 Tax=Iridovirus sp. TaxID=135728 RepID=A0AAU7YF10_9VIRU|nr:419L [Invertebrate iridescent virus Kaz2018]